MNPARATPGLGAIIRRRPGLTLVLAGLLLLIVSQTLLRPASFESERDDLRGSTPSLRGYVLRGPAVGTYDPALDVTHAVFACSHWFCDYAITLNGDQTDRLSRSHFVAMASRGAPGGLEPFDPPIVLGEPFAPVGNTTRAEFTLKSPHPRALVATVGVLAIALGVSTRAPTPGSRRAVAIAALVGAVVGHAYVARAGIVALLLTMFVFAPALALGGILMLFKPTRAAGFTLAAWALTTFVTGLAGRAYFPAGPEL